MMISRDVFKKALEELAETHPALFAVLRYHEQERVRRDQEVSKTLKGIAIKLAELKRKLP